MVEIFMRKHQSYIVNLNWAIVFLFPIFIGCHDINQKRKNSIVNEIDSMLKNKDIFKAIRVIDREKEILSEFDRNKLREKLLIIE